MGGRSFHDGVGISLGRLEVRPGGPPAPTYGAEADHELTPVERSIKKRLAKLGLQHEGAMSRMARELAASAPNQVNIPPALVDGLMAWAGLFDPPPRLVVVEIPDDRNDCAKRSSRDCRGPIDSLVSQVETSRPEAKQVQFGVGVVALESGATRMIAALGERAVQLDPVPVAVEQGASVPVRGRLVGERKDPSLELVDPDGRWSTLPAVVGDDGSFMARVACVRGRGAYQVEVLAEGQHGPEVVANFPVHCGVDPPDRIEVEVEELDPDVSADQIARANFEHLNEARRVRGLAPLEWDDRVARIAEAHSLDMQKNGFVGHRSPTTGDVADRFEAAKVKGSVIRENVARGYGPKGIHDSLMKSPGHRVNMLAEDVTHVGIGIVIAPPETDMTDAPRPLFATQEFLARPGAGGPPDRELPSTLLRRIDARRSAAGLRAVGWDDRLSRLAQREARAKVRGRKGRRVTEKEIFALGFKAVERHEVQSGSFEALAGLDLWSRARLPHIGLGVARSTARADEGAFVLVILVGER
jgi:uncharacterized protein YkwD